MHLVCMNLAYVLGFESFYGQNDNNVKYLIGNNSMHVNKDEVCRSLADLLSTGIITM